MPPTNTRPFYDALIIGGGAAGLMCGLSAGRRGKRVAILEHNASVGAKILISGGGRCNFTNLDVEPGRFISGNPHFAKSALARYTAYDFMGFLGEAGLAWHEKTLGQLFCDQKSGAVVKALTDACAAAGAELITRCAVKAVATNGDQGYRVETDQGAFHARQLVVASGGLSIPKMGATGLAYDIARQFDVPVVPPEPALVPFTFDDATRAKTAPLAGVAQPCTARTGKTGFVENLLFTHRGLSGPAILQISSYWRPGMPVVLDLLSGQGDAGTLLQTARAERPGQAVSRVLSEHMPKRLAAFLAEPDHPLGQLSNKAIAALADRLHRWQVIPTGTEGFKKAEVTRGGVDTHALDSRTMAVKGRESLYFIGECVDVTGWLGGYNFQWAWSSGWAAAQAL
ncbi:BaiN/RdsA family NAD(P)/FAD-dependent oxidoreductase [Yunchengibacter salinarum]|uniref:NAD(P)/FAD-dependent oxidoreductase n=1 Tax=Yunchengibacter salinarum TaxID=3133399 RepID=UPI0035B5F205